MKRIRLLLHSVMCILFMLSAFVFVTIGGWQLLSGDWTLFENDQLALVQIVAKIMLSLYCFVISLRAVLRRKKSCLWAGVQLLGITLAAAPFISNHLGYLFVVFAVLFLLSELNVWTTVFGKNATTNPQQSQVK